MIEVTNIKYKEASIDEENGDIYHKIEIHAIEPGAGYSEAIAKTEKLKKKIINRAKQML